MELKDWLDLGQGEHKADLVKAILALANHGGGYVLIGYDDVTRDPSLRPANFVSGYDQDTVNGIVRSYADPQIHIQVEHSPDARGNNHPVVIVPGGHSVPVRCKRDGPNRVHVRQHSIYIRRPGPTSEEPQTAQEWQELIRRCVLNDRNNLLEQVSSILQPHSATTETEGAPVSDLHRSWLENSQERFEELNDQSFDGIIDQGPFALGYWRAAYTITPERTDLSLPFFRDELRRIVGNETGWPVGIFMERDGARPRPHEGCVELWLAEAMQDPAVSDYWKACPNGSFVLFRGYQEDSTEWEQARNPGEQFDFLTPIWRVGEVLLHGYRFADRFSGEGASMRVTMMWTGLEGRMLSNYQPTVYSTPHGRRSQQDQVIVSVGIEDALSIDANLYDLVDELTRPLYEIFDFFRVPRQTLVAELDEMRYRRGRNR
ncbi:MAG: ATP-binding protein [Rubrobacter sp.]|nr:ATP-binding protein [Rubrobacter sp.]